MGFSDDDDGTTSKHNNVLYSMMRFTDRLLGVEMEEIPTYASPVLGRSPVLGSERQRIDERGRQSLAIEKPALYVFLIVSSAHHFLMLCDVPVVSG